MNMRWANAWQFSSCYSLVACFLRQWLRGAETLNDQALRAMAILPDM